MTDSTSATPRDGFQAFPHTRWSVVLTAGSRDTTRAHEALAHLCETYWYPLYAYTRRRGYSPHDAQDLTQEFFTRLLEGHWIARADQQKGRFRSFLLTALNRFLADEWDKARAQKRGGGKGLVSLDTEAGERQYLEEPAGEMSPDRIYDRRWALALLEQTMVRLRAEFAQAGKAGEFDRLKVFLTADRQDLGYAEAAAAAGMSEGAVRVAAHRLRRRYRELFREEIAHTVSEPGEVEAELRYLMAVMAER